MGEVSIPFGYIATPPPLGYLEISDRNDQLKRWRFFHMRILPNMLMKPEHAALRQLLVEPEAAHRVDDDTYWRERLATLLLDHYVYWRQRGRDVVRHPITMDNITRDEVVMVLRVARRLVMPNPQSLLQMRWESDALRGRMAMLNAAASPTAAQLGVGPAMMDLEPATAEQAPLAWMTPQGDSPPEDTPSSSAGGAFSGSGGSLLGVATPNSPGSIFWPSPRSVAGAD